MKAGSAILEPTAHVAIIGMGRSGSTFLEGRIAETFGGVAVGELPGVWGAFRNEQRLCACSLAPGDCPFWSGVLRRYQGLARSETLDFMCGMNKRMLPIRNCYSWPLRAAVARRALSADLNCYLQEMRALYEALGHTAREAGYQILVDSSKHPFWYQLAAQGGALAPFAPRQTIRIVRHPAAVFYSLRRPGDEMTAGGRGQIQRSYGLHQAVPYWLVMNLFGDRVAGNASIRVRYEDLADERYLSELVRTGLKCSASARSHSTFSHQLVGNPSRQGVTPTTFRLDTRWKDQKRSASEKLSWRLLRRVLRKYGYTQ